MRLEEELKTSIEQGVELTAKLREKCDELHIAVEEKKGVERKFEEIRSEVEILQSDINERNERIEVLETQLMKFEGSRADIMKSYETLQSERERLQEKLTRSTLEIEELQEKVSALEEAKAALGVKISELEKAKADDVAEILAKNAREIEDHKKEKETLMQLVEDLTVKSAEVDAERTEEVTRYQNEIEDLTLKNFELSEGIIAVQAELDEARQSKDSDVLQLTVANEELTQRGVYRIWFEFFFFCMSCCYF